MYKKVSNRGAVKGLSGSPALILALIISIMYSYTSAANRIDIDAADEWGIPVDSLPTDQTMDFRIWIENDIVLSGINLGFKVWSDDGAFWQWSYACETGEGPSFVCPVPGSRADDPAVFDMTGIMLVETDTDGISPDTFLIGAIALFNGLPTGPLEPLYAASFTPGNPDRHFISTVCIDSCFVPPGGAFIFVDGTGGSIFPTTLWPPGGRCWPTTGTYCFAQWDEDQPAEMTVVHCASNSVTLAASHSSRPVRFYLLELNGGSGQAIVTDNGDGTCEVSYAAVPEDVGQDITVTIDADCDGSDASTSPYLLSINVINDPPVLNSGSWLNPGATCEMLVKDDIGVEDADGCDVHQFFIISGPGDIEPTSGLYTWLPGPSDNGEYVVTIGVTDGVESAQGSFSVQIADQGCLPGDADNSGTVDIGDAVYIVYYVFRDGPPPPIMNWADVNADCHVNVGDAIYLINHIFKSGPAPQLGCYY